jgi:hypothetical protein
VAASDAAQVAAAPAALRGYFLTAARDYALPPALLAAVGDVESGFNPAAVGPPVPGGPAEGMMQFLPSSFALFNVVAGATPFDPGPEVIAAARHLLSSGAQPGGGFDAAAGLFGYNHSHTYVEHVLAVAAGYGYRYGPPGPPNDPVRYHQPLTVPGTATGDPAAGPLQLAAAPGTGVLACGRAAVLTITPPDPTAHRLGAVVLRGEDGYLYTYTGLQSLTTGLRAGTGPNPGTVLEPGARLGVTAGSLGFGIRHSTAAPWVDPRPYLALWPGTPTTAPTVTPRAAPSAPALGATR